MHCELPGVTQSAIKFIDNQLSNNSSILGNRLIKKLQGEPLSKLPNIAQSIIDLYLSHSNSHENDAQHLELLRDEFKTRSFCEMRSKYAAWISQGGLSQSEDPFYLMILKWLLGDATEGLLTQEVNALQSTVLSSQSEWAAVRRDEMLRLVIQGIKSERNKIGEEFNCLVLDYRELLPLLQMLEQRHQKKKNEKENRCLLLVRNEVHYTAIDCQYKDGGKYAVILDASQDPKHQILEAALEKAGFQLAIAGADSEDRLQWDARSCSIFSLTQLEQTAKDPFYFKQLAKQEQFNAKTHRIAWSYLDFDLVKGCQKLSFFDNYRTLHQLNGAPLPLQLDLSRNCEAEKNRYIEDQLLKFQLKAHEELKKSSPADANAIARTHPFMALLNL